MAERIAQLIKEIGRGKHAARSLSETDAHALGAALWAGEIPDAQQGAILIALRMKGESALEILGLMRALEAVIEPRKIDSPTDKPLLIIPSYSGARRQPNLLPLLVQMLRRLGMRVLIHFADNRERVTTAAILQALGEPIATSRQVASELLRERALALVPLELVAPMLAELLSWRDTLGVRNVGHTLVKLLNPCAVHALPLVPLTHPAYFALIREYFAARGVRGLVMRGCEGEAVASPRRLPPMAWFDTQTWHTLPGCELAEMPHVPALDALATADFVHTSLSVPNAVPVTLAAQAANLLYASGLSPDHASAAARVAATFA